MEKATNDCDLTSTLEKVALLKKKIAKIDALIRKLEVRKDDLLYNEMIPLAAELAISCPHKNIKTGRTSGQGLDLQVCEDCGCSRVWKNIDRMYRESGGESGYWTSWDLR